MIDVRNCGLIARVDFEEPVLYIQAVMTHEEI